MFTRDQTLTDLMARDKFLWQTSLLILDYVGITGSATEAEIEEYLQFYRFEIQAYRIATISMLMEMGLLAHKGGAYVLTEKWKQSDGLGPYFLEYVDSLKLYSR